MAASLLDRDEPPAVEVVNATGRGNAVLVCDHASNRIPRCLGSLGLDPAQLTDHIAWDSGAAEVGRRLAAYLDAPLILSGYSRLVIDCNRSLYSTESIPEKSDGIPIPGNVGLGSKERDIRITCLFQPYHHAIDTLLDKRLSEPGLLLSIHSFTPILDGTLRPWKIGVSYGSNCRLAMLIREAIINGMNGTNSIVGDNQPYPIEDHIDYTIPVHGEGRGLPSAMIEIRQDQIRSTIDADDWAVRLAKAYQSIESEVLDK